jgi:SAM-dependent methyltransferase
MNTKTDFSTEQYDDAYPAGIEAHYWHRARTAKIQSILKHYDVADKRVLEIGCGRGVVVNELRERGVDCIGVELAPVDVPPSLRTVINAGTDFRNLPESLRASIDAILILDVLEHVPDPQIFLKEVQSSFPNAEFLISTVPARAELWSNYDEYYGHYVRYSCESLRTLIVESGYTPVLVSYFFHLLYIPARIFSLFGLDRSIQVSAPKGFGKSLHCLLGRLFEFEERIISPRIYGTSVIGVAKINHGENV